MTNPWRTDADQADPGMDRLGDAWDALVAGDRPTGTKADAELMALVGQLSNEASPIRPTLTFRNSLRETLMHTSPTAAQSAPTFYPLPKLGRPVEIGQSIRPSATSLPSRIRATGMRWAALAATISLLLASAGGAYLAGRGPGDGNPTRIPGFAQASPTAAVPYVDGCPGQPYFPCGSDPMIGQALVVGTLFPAESTAGTDVTMLGWQVGPGETVTFDVDDPGIVPGIAIDIVVDGAYAATFSGPVVVMRPNPLGTSIDYPDAGDLVELTKGDAVSFAQGTRVELINLLEERPLDFKSVVIHDSLAEDTGEPGYATVEGNPMGGPATMVKVGTGTLPMPISQYPRQEFGVFLSYSQIYPDLPVPTTVGDSTLIMGPVDPTDFIFPELAPEDGTEGFFLWLYVPKG